MVRHKNTKSGYGLEYGNVAYFVSRTRFPSANLSQYISIRHVARGCFYVSPIIVKFVFSISRGVSYLSVIILIVSVPDVIVEYAVNKLFSIFVATDWGGRLAYVDLLLDTVNPLRNRSFCEPEHRWEPVNHMNNRVYFTLRKLGFWRVHKGWRQCSSFKQRVFPALIQADH